MSALTLSSFDTLRYVKALKEADVPEKQAEAQAEALRSVLEATQADQAAQLATKGDLALMRKELDLVRSDLRGEISTLKWMLGFMLAAIASLVLKAYF